MQRLRQIIDQINGPAKVCSFRKALISSLILFLGSVFLLVVYKPFGNWFNQGEVSFKLNFVISIIISGTYFVMETGIGLLFRRTRLKIYLKRWHYFIYRISIYLVAALFLHLFENYLSQSTHINFLSVLDLFFKVFLVSLFSNLILTIYVLVKILQSASARNDINLKVFEGLPGEMITRKVVIGSETENDMLQLNLFDLYYIQAVENYVELIRNTLKNVALQLEKTPVVRCHRSYMVNLSHLQKIKGNALGYKLKLKNLDETLAVSRSYVSTFKKLITKYLTEDTLSKV